MKTGTKSLLFGVHQFIWHPVTVWLAWLWLYRRPPGPRVTICIVIHDWGYWGAPEMDGPIGSAHPYLGAWIAGCLFGPQFYDLCLNHSRELSTRRGVEPSKLCWADKFSMLFEPPWFYLARARLSGELAEYRDRAADRKFIERTASDRAWLSKLKARLAVHARAKAKEFQSCR